MSTNRFQHTNKSLAELDLLGPAVDTFLSELKEIEIDWNNGTLKKGSLKLIEHFVKASLGTVGSDKDLLLTADARSMLLRILLDFETLLNGEQRGSYIFERLIGAGKESAVFLAKHALMGREVAIKIFYERDAVRRYAGLFSFSDGFNAGNREVFVLPLDVFPIEVPAIYNTTAELEAVVFPYRKGETLAEFIKNDRPLTPFFVREFITQVGGGLAQLHRSNIAHGDLHQDNIIVEDLDNSRLRFTVVDFTGCREEDVEAHIRIDWEGFRDILVYILSRIPLTHMSLQRHLGAKTFCLVEAVLDGRINNSVDLEVAKRDGRFYSEYETEREKFIAEKFKANDSLSLVRHEEITSPAAARELFVPFQPFFQEFSEFGSAILHGHRGSGKSSYVAALAMLPNSGVEFVDPRDKFGILFACRQGEFKQLRALKPKKASPAFAELKHLLIVKIIRKTLETLHECITHNALGLADDFEVDGIVEFLMDVFPVGASATFQASTYERLESIYEATVRYELEFTDDVLGHERTISSAKMLREQSLVQFLRAVRSSSGVLGRARFFLLFDDCGAPNMPDSMQRVLNELLRAANDVFCVKVTAERFSYIEEDSDAKVLESPHDYTPFNLAESLILRGGQKVERGELKKYFEHLLQKRLQASHSSDEIRDYLGESFASMTEFVRNLHEDPLYRGAYAGWDIIWQVADRTPRHLLEMISSIFAKAEIRPESPPSKIPKEIQDDAVRAYSASKLRHISYIPGKIQAGSVTVPLGQHLYNITAAFGKICRLELNRPRMGGKRERYHEKLGIEIDKVKELGKQAEQILDHTIRYAIFDDSLMGSTRDGGLKQVLYVFNRIYAPAFGLSVRREANWAIRSGRFEAFLHNPIAEARARTTRNKPSPDLFDNE